MVVAHPDDEIIFGYSQILKYQQHLHIFCATNSDHPIRCNEFKYVAGDIFGVSHEILDYPDLWDDDFSGTDLAQRLANIVPNYNTVITHNEFGEYGHSQHKALHNIVKPLAKGELLVFDKGAHVLPFDWLRNKLNILEHSYTSQYELGTYSWYDQNNPDNRMIDFIVNESTRRIK